MDGHWAATNSGIFKYSHFLNSCKKKNFSPKKNIRKKVREESGWNKQNGDAHAPFRIWKKARLEM